MYQPQMQQPMQYPYQQYPQQVQQVPMQAAYPVMQQQPYIPYGSSQSIGMMGNVPNNSYDRNVINDRYDRSPAPVATPVPVASPVVNNNSNETILPLRDAEMNREQHILFAGDTYRLDYTKRAAIAVENSKALVMTDMETDSVQLNPNILMSTSLNMSIFESCIIQRQKQNDNADANLFRYFAYIVEPFVTSENYRDVVNNVTSQLTIRDMCKVLKSTASSLNSIEHQQKLELVNIIEYLDRHITAAINSYMGTELGIPVRIDSVITDGADLVDYLKSGLATELVNKFLEWEKTISSSLKSIDEEQEASFRDGMIEGPMVSVTLVPTCVTITLLQLMDKELGFKLLPDKVYTIDPVRHVMIYNIAKTLEAHSSTMDLKPLYNYMVTLDKVKYTLHKSHGKFEDVYMIRLA
jgi:ribosomal protein L31E